MKIIFILSLLIVPSLAFGEDYELIMDDPAVVFAGVNGDRVTITSPANKSYCCTVLYEYKDGGFVSPAFVSITNIQGGSSLDLDNLTGRGSEFPVLATVGPAGSSSGRICHNAPYSSSAQPILTAFEIGSKTSASGNLRAKCEETSLMGNYNTVSAEFNFLEITVQSATSTKVTGQIILLSSTGRDLVTSSFEFTGVGLTRQDFAIHELIGEGMDFGKILILHNGAPGQVRARISQYDVTSTSPLNFVLVGQEKLETTGVN